jgi:hypothetical protein
MNEGNRRKYGLISYLIFARITAGGFFLLLSNGYTTDFFGICIVPTPNIYGSLEAQKSLTPTNHS